MKSHHHAKLSAIEVTATFNKAFKEECAALEAKIRSGASGDRRHAKSWIDRELTQVNVRELRDTMFVRLYSVMKEVTPVLIHTMVRSVMHSLADLIVSRRAMEFNDLLAADYHHLLMGSIHTTAAVSLNQHLKYAVNDKAALVASIQDETAYGRDSGVLFRNSQSGQSKYSVKTFNSGVKTDAEYMADIRRSFNNSSIRLK